MLGRRRQKGGIVIESIITLLGLALVIKGGMLGTSTYRLIHKAESAEGVITGITNHGFTAAVQVNVGNGGVVFLQDGLFYGRQVNDKVDVDYDPANPQHATVKAFTALWFDTFVCAAGGLILLAWGFSMRSKRSL